MNRTITLLLFFLIFFFFILIWCGAESSEESGPIVFNLFSVAPGSFYVGDNPPARNNVSLDYTYQISETEVTYALCYYGRKSW